MSWDATLIDDRGHLEGDWNYTHNCNRMANAVLYPDENTDLSTAYEVLRFQPRNWVSWWQVLDGMEGKQGAQFLRVLIDGLTADPERFRAMNPENGWGDYDSFLAILREMYLAAPDWPCEWRTFG